LSFSSSSIFSFSLFLSFAFILPVRWRLLPFACVWSVLESSGVEVDFLFFFFFLNLSFRAKAAALFDDSSGIIGLGRVGFTFGFEFEFRFGFGLGFGLSAGVGLVFLAVISNGSFFWPFMWALLARSLVTSPVGGPPNLARFSFSFCHCRISSCLLFRASRCFFSFSRLRRIPSSSSPRLAKKMDKRTKLISFSLLFSVRYPPKEGRRFLRRLERVTMAPSRIEREGRWGRKSLPTRKQSITQSSIIFSKSYLNGSCCGTLSSFSRYSRRILMWRNW